KYSSFKKTELCGIGIFLWLCGCCCQDASFDVLHRRGTQQDRTICTDHEMTRPVKGDAHFLNLVFVKCAKLPRLDDLKGRLPADARNPENLPIVCPVNIHREERRIA